MFACFLILSGCGTIQSMMQPPSSPQSFFNPENMERDFTVLFGTTASGDIHLEYETPEKIDGQPGVQDIIYSRWDTFSPAQQNRLEQINREARRAYMQWTVLQDMGNLDQLNFKKQQTAQTVGNLLTRMLSIYATL